MTDKEKRKILINIISSELEKMDSGAALIISAAVLHIKAGEKLTFGKYSYDPKKE
jgi:hypothetical protein